MGVSFVCWCGKHFETSVNQQSDVTVINLKRGPKARVTVIVEDHKSRIQCSLNVRCVGLHSNCLFIWNETDMIEAVMREKERHICQFKNQQKHVLHPYNMLLTPNLILISLYTRYTSYRVPQIQHAYFICFVVARLLEKAKLPKLSWRQLHFAYQSHLMSYLFRDISQICTGHNELRWR